MSGFQKHNYYAIFGSVGIFTALIIVGVKIETALILSLAGYLGANFPDLDTASIPSMWAARISFISSWYFIYIEKPIYAVAICMVFIAPKTYRHRGWTHKYFTPVWIVASVYFLFREYTLIAICFSFGLLIHYAVDRMNPLRLKNII